MMESICLDDSSDSDADPDWDHADLDFAGPRTPSTVSDNPEGESDPQHRGYEDADDGSDEDYGGSTHVAPKKKKGGYDSRIEQILYENPDLPILIVDAGKSLESGGKYIVYTIRTGVSLKTSCGSTVLNLTRTLKSVADTLNLLLSEMHFPDYIPL